MGNTGWSASEWARRAGVSGSTITRFLSKDDAAMIKEATLDKLRGVTPRSSLLDSAEYPSGNSPQLARATGGNTLLGKATIRPIYKFTNTPDPERLIEATRVFDRWCRSKGYDGGLPPKILISIFEPLAALSKGRNISVDDFDVFANTIEALANKK